MEDPTTNANTGYLLQLIHKTPVAPTHRVASRLLDLVHEVDVTVTAVLVLVVAEVVGVGHPGGVGS